MFHLTTVNNINKKIDLYIILFIGKTVISRKHISENEQIDRYRIHNVCTITIDKMHTWY
jgi:hypothetical protein